MTKVKFVKFGAVIAGAAMLALGGVGAANAVPAYGYAYLELQNFTLTAPGAAITACATCVRGSTGADYPGFAQNPSNTSTFGNIGTGVNAPQATAGPGPFPGPDVYTQQMLGSEGTRADMRIVGPITGALSQTVSEGNLKVFNSAASSTAGSSTTLQIKFTTTGGPVTLSFLGRSVEQVFVGALGDSASAQTSISGNLCLNGGGCVAITDLLAAAPGHFPGDAGSPPQNTVAPVALNHTISTSDPTNPVVYDSGVIPYSFQSGLLAAGTYTLTLSDQTQILLAAIPAPEPSTLALAGSALIGLAFFAQRRRRKQNALA